MADPRYADIDALPIGEIAQRLNLPVKRDGNGEYIPCPDPHRRHQHDQRKPRCGLSKAKPVANCLKCGWSGNSVQLVQTIRGGTYSEACEWIRAEFGLSDRPTVARQQYQDALHELCAARGWGVDAALSVGAQADGELVRFPMYDHQRSQTGGKRRRGDNQPVSPGVKAKTEAGSKNGLFYPEDLPADGPVLVVEGEADLMAVLSAGHRGAVATPGATPGAAVEFYLQQLLHGRRVVLLPQRGEPAQQWLENIGQCLRQAQCHVEYVPAGRRHDDPDEVLRYEQDKPAALRRMLSQAVPWISTANVQAGGRDLPEVVLPGGTVPIRETASKLGALLAATGRYFTRGTAVVTVVTDDNGELVQQLVKPAALPSAFEAVANLVKWKAAPGGEPEKVPATCSEATARLVLHAEPFLSALPPIRVLSRCPVLIERDGELVQVVGYDRDSGILAAGERVPDVPLEEARNLLYGALEDFRFASDADRARALAALITPALVFGDHLKGRAPVDLAEADNSQSGKGYRTRLVAAFYRDHVRTVTQRDGRGCGSLQESIDAAIVRGSCFIGVDNVRGRVDLPALESMLTEDVYVARTPYSPPIEVDPRKIVVLMTSNSAEPTVDLANRVCCTRILKQRQGYRFKRYPEGDLLDHVRANQPTYLGAVFAIIRAWHSAGKHRSQEVRHDFRPWVQTLDWICQAILGTVPIMDGHEAARERMTNPAMTWLRNVAIAVVRAGHAGAWLRAHRLLDLIVDEPGIDVPGLSKNGDPEDDTTRAKILQAMGRRLGKLFQGDTVTVDSIVIRRRDAHDDQYRPTKEYEFTPIVDPAIGSGRIAGSIAGCGGETGAEPVQNAETPLCARYAPAIGSNAIAGSDNGSSARDLRSSKSEDPAIPAILPNSVYGAQVSPLDNYSMDPIAGIAGSAGADDEDDIDRREREAVQMEGCGRPVEGSSE